MPEGEGVLILLQQYLRLYVPEFTCFHQNVVVVLHSIKHPCVICIFHNVVRKIVYLFPPFVLFCLLCIWELTDRPIWNKRLVVETEDLSDIVHVRVLNNKSPLAEVHAIVEVGDADFNTPVVLIVNLDVPVHTNWAHMVGAVEQRRVIFLRSVQTHHAENFRVTPVVKKVSGFKPVAN